jgi:hypothetical protein
MRRIFTITVLTTLALSAAAHAAGPTIPMAPRSFARADVDKDGKLTLTELTPFSQRNILRLDQNGDQAISRAEIEAKLMQSMQARITRMVDNMDTDKNGTITQAELDGLLKIKFTKADSNGDGALSLEEAQAYKLASRAEMRQALRKAAPVKAAP